MRLPLLVTTLLSFFLCGHSYGMELYCTTEQRVRNSEGEVLQVSDVEKDERFPEGCKQARIRITAMFKGASKIGDKVEVFYSAQHWICPPSVELVAGDYGTFFICREVDDQRRLMLWTGSWVWLHSGPTIDAIRVILGGERDSRIAGSTVAPATGPSTPAVQFIRRSPPRRSSTAASLSAHRLTNATSPRPPVAAL